KKTGVIFGSDKPYVKYDSKGFYSVFLDACVRDYGNFQQDDNFERVNFYNDGPADQLTIKQAHVVAAFLDHVRQENLNFDGVQYINMISRLIYDLKNPLKNISTKSTTHLFSIRDTFLLKNKESEMYKIYQEGIKKLDLPIQTLETVIETKRYYLS